MNPNSGVMNSSIRREGCPDAASSCNPAAGTSLRSSVRKSVALSSPYSLSPHWWSCSSRPSSTPYFRGPVISSVLGSTVAMHDPACGTLELALLPIADAYAGMMLWDISHAERVVRAWARWSASAPEEVTTALRIMRFPPIPELPPFLRGRPRVWGKPDAGLPS